MVSESVHENRYKSEKTENKDMPRRRRKVRFKTKDGWVEFYVED